MRIAYLLGLVLGPFVLLGTVFAMNDRGPENCSVRGGVQDSAGHPIMLEHCTGALGITTREPRRVDFIS